MGVNDFGEGKGLVDEGFKIARDDVVEDVLLGFGKLYGICSDLKEGVSPDSEEFAECGEERVGSWFGGESTVLEDDAVFGGGCGECFDDFAADGVEDDSSAL